MFEGAPVVEVFVAGKEGKDAVPDDVPLGPGKMLEDPEDELELAGGVPPTEGKRELSCLVKSSILGVPDVFELDPKFELVGLPKLEFEVGFDPKLGLGVGVEGEGEVKVEALPVLLPKLELPVLPNEEGFPVLVPKLEFEELPNVELSLEEAPAPGFKKDSSCLVRSSMFGTDSLEEVLDPPEPEPLPPKPELLLFANVGTGLPNPEDPPLESEAPKFEDAELDAPGLLPRAPFN